MKNQRNKLNGIQEVSGSIPLISTKTQSPEALKDKASGLFYLLFAKDKKGVKKSAIINPVINNFCLYIASVILRRSSSGAS